MRSFSRHGHGKAKCVLASDNPTESYAQEKAHPERSMRERSGWAFGLPKVNEYHYSGFLGGDFLSSFLSFFLLSFTGGTGLSGTGLAGLTSGAAG